MGKDVAQALGYQNANKAMADHVDDEDKMQGDGVTIRDPIGREQHPTIINESGLYSLVLSSKLPTARKFKRWVMERESLLQMPSQTTLTRKIKGSLN